KFSLINSGDGDVVIFPSRSRTFGSSTTMISKFCMLWAVGAHRPASRILYMSRQGTGLWGSKRSRAECRASMIFNRLSIVSPEHKYTFTLYLFIAGQGAIKVTHGIPHSRSGGGRSTCNNLYRTTPAIRITDSGDRPCFTEP